MIFKEKEIILKDGRRAIIKTPEAEDAEQLLNYIKTASGETEFLTRYPEEWAGMTVEKEVSWINQLRASQNKFMLACYVGGNIVGNCELTAKSGIKDRHRSTVGIGILKEFWGLGIGSAFFEEMIKAAKDFGSEIMELEFLEGNERALHLYEKFGFNVVSERPNMFKLKDGSYKKEFYMQKYL